LYGLIFDVDGVIADTEPVNARASIRALESVCGLAGVRAEDFAAGLGRGAEKYVMAAAEVHGFRMTAEQVDRAVREREENFLRCLEEEPLPPLPGVLELMHEALAAADFGVAIATSSTRAKSGAVLKAAGVPTERVAWVTADDVTRKKPDPELFLTAARRLGAEPGRCVVFEDAPDGVLAARAAGAKCVAVTTTVAAAALSGADRVARDLSEVSLETVRHLLEDTSLAK
jgi:sugar-phosphatase